MKKLQEEPTVEDIAWTPRIYVALDVRWADHQAIMSPFRKFYQNDQFLNSFTMYSNSSSYNSSYMDSIDSKIPPISFKLGEEGPEGWWEILSHIPEI